MQQAEHDVPLSPPTHHPPTTTHPAPTSIVGVCILGKGLAAALCVHQQLSALLTGPQLAQGRLQRSAASRGGRGLVAVKRAGHCCASGRKKLSNTQQLWVCHGAGGGAAGAASAGTGRDDKLSAWLDEVDALQRSGQKSEKMGATKSWVRGWMTPMPCRSEARKVRKWV